jgi:hypothetical protein
VIEISDCDAKIIAKLQHEQRYTLIAAGRTIADRARAYDRGGAPDKLFPRPPSLPWRFSGTVLN